MFKREKIAALVATSILATSAPITPIFAQAQTPQTNAAGQICQTFISNATPYGYVGVDNVDLGAVFDSIDTISGTIGGTRTTGASTLTIPASPPVGKWRNQGYKVPAWGPTGGWTSYTEYLGGAPSGTAQMQTDVIDVRFGRDDGINPGKTMVPQGVHGLYVVQRNETGHAPLKLNIQNFNLTICGKPKSGKLCKILSVGQNPAARFSPAAQIPANFGAPKKVVSVTGSLTVPAFNVKPAETKSVQTIPVSTQPRTDNFLLSMNNRHFRFFSVPSNHVTTNPVDTWRAKAGQPYLSLGSSVIPGDFVSPVNSWAGAVGVTDNPAHGDAAGNIEVCVQ